MKFKLLGKLLNNGIYSYLVSTEGNYKKLSEAEFVYILGRNGIENALGKAVKNTIAVKLLDQGGRIVDLHNVPDYDNSNYTVTCRYTKDNKDVGYKLTNGIKEINLSLDDTIKLIQKGKVNNAVIQSLDNKQICGACGTVFSKLPIVAID